MMRLSSSDTSSPGRVELDRGRGRPSGVTAAGYDLRAPASPLLLQSLRPMRSSAARLRRRRQGRSRSGPATARAGDRERPRARRGHRAVGRRAWLGFSPVCGPHVDQDVRADDRDRRLSLPWLLTGLPVGLVGECLGRPVLAQVERPAEVRGVDARHESGILPSPAVALLAVIRRPAAPRPRHTSSAVAGSERCGSGVAVGVGRAVGGALDGVACPHATSANTVTATSATNQVRVPIPRSDGVRMAREGYEPFDAMATLRKYRFVRVSRGRGRARRARGRRSRCSRE